jgi:hypothetical protein
MFEVSSAVKTLLNDFASNGYCVMPSPPVQEQEWLHAFVQEKWLGALRAGHPEIETEAIESGISHYHDIAGKLDHGAFWTKDRRIFSPIEVDALLQTLSVFDTLRSVFGNFRVEDIEGIGYPEIYWRLVRPGTPSDVAIAHKDTWFFSITNHMSPEQQVGIIKVWLPVVTQVGGSGLAVSPGSHKVDIPYKSEVRHGRAKPTGDVAVLDAFPMTLLPLEVGQAVAFDKGLLHKGVAHEGDITRVSIEFAIRVLEH